MCARSIAFIANDILEETNVFIFGVFRIFMVLRCRGGATKIYIFISNLLVFERSLENEKTVFLAVPYACI